MDNRKKFYLFKQSKNFCSVPWNHFKVSMDGEISTCTYGSEYFGNLKETSIQNILSNTKIIDIKENLIKDQADPNCKLCVSYENNGITRPYKYLKDLYNPMFIDSKVNYENTKDFLLNGVDLHWSSICNLKCITCWAKQSSSIAKEQNLPVLHTPPEQADELINYIIENQKNLKEIYLSGGEPTLIKYNLKLLKRLDKRNDLQIRINTNMSFSHNNQIIEELKKFPNVLFTISADALHDKFDYIRRGSDWNLFIKNLESLQKYHFKWRVNSVFFACSAFDLLDTMNYFRSNFNIHDFTINQLQLDHTTIRARNLPDETKNMCIQKYNEEMQKNIGTNLMGQLLNCLDELNQDRTESYTSFLDSIDVKEGKNWRNIFPELNYE